MENLLIVESNLAQAHFWTNCICKKIMDIRLYQIALTGMEAIEILKNKEVDIVILDLELSDMSGFDIIEYITKNNITKYNSSIIVITDHMELLNYVIQNKCVFSYCSKINDIDFIIQTINNLICEKKKEHSVDNIKEQIITELEKINFKFCYDGTKYLVDAIYECYCQNMIYNINFNKNIYPIISEKYKKSIETIRTNIFNSVLEMYNDTEEKILSNYFGYKVVSKPRNKDIIITILRKIR